MEKYDIDFVAKASINNFLNHSILVIMVSAKCNSVSINFKWDENYNVNTG